MFSRFRIALGFAVLLSLVFAIPAFAGGWAVITLDELPSGVAAGKPLTVGFTVLQHGKTPIDGLAPTITATLLKEEQFVVNAEPSGKPGHYTATLTFPKAGDWRWSIQAFTMDQLMPMLSVAAPSAVTLNQPVVKTEPVAASTSPLLIVRVLAFAVGLAGLLLAYQRRSRLALALTVVAISIGLASFLIGSPVPEVEAQTQGESSSEILSDSFVSQVELGRQLFVAKGCITCHVNNKVERASAYWTIEMGAANLTNFSASPEILRIRLKDPAAAKSDTQMPNLNLSDAEIEALIAFINSK
ncbi:MAG TPA: c-type cytochrome [Anaerolineales bacterium]|nr:c-type cytochrome [Anaerolineales bacterium]